MKCKKCKAEVEKEVKLTLTHFTKISKKDFNKVMEIFRKWKN